VEIIIRQVKKGDGRSIADFQNKGIKSGFYKYTGMNEPRTLKKIREWNKRYAKKQKNTFLFIAIDKKTGKTVGSCSFSASKSGRTRHRGDIGWVVDPDYKRKGIATKLLKAVLKEAKKRGFKRAEAEAAVKNISSIKLAAKCGLKIEGRKKAGLLLDNGTYVDTYIFGKAL